ncbi:hypothetical protein BKA93DRAFT_821626 [Sparassis latifolia]
MSEAHVVHLGNVDLITGLPNGPYRVSGSGVNGNRWFCVVTSEGRGYRYLNKNGSVYYRSRDGASYFNNGRGSFRYTSPTGVTVWNV